MPHLTEAQERALGALSYEWQPPLVNGRPSSSFDCLWRKGLAQKTVVDGLPYYKLEDLRTKASAPA